MCFIYYYSVYKIQRGSKPPSQNMYLAEEKSINWLEKTKEYKITPPQTKTNLIKK